MGGLTENDWKYLSKIRKDLLEELSRRINEEVAAALAQTGVSEDEKRYEVYRIVRDRDRDVAAAFDDWRRSQMFLIVLNWRRLGLLTDEHLTHLTPEGAKAIRDFRREEQA